MALAVPDSGGTEHDEQEISQERAVYDGRGAFVTGLHGFDAITR